MFSIFTIIYEEKKIPEQWKTAKVIPLHKKGPKDDIWDYWLVLAVVKAVAYLSQEWLVVNVSSWSKIGHKFKSWSVIEHPVLTWFTGECILLSDEHMNKVKINYKKALILL